MDGSSKSVSTDGSGASGGAGRAGDVVSPPGADGHNVGYTLTSSHFWFRNGGKTIELRDGALSRGTTRLLVDGNRVADDCAFLYEFLGTLGSVRAKAIGSGDAPTPVTEDVYDAVCAAELPASIRVSGIRVIDCCRCQCSECALRLGVHVDVDVDIEDVEVRTVGDMLRLFAGKRTASRDHPFPIYQYPRDAVFGYKVREEKTIIIHRHTCKGSVRSVDIAYKNACGKSPPRMSFVFGRH